MGTPLTIHILAGGTSQRMGTDKKEMLLQGIAMLDWCRRTAETLDVKVRVITEDLRKGQGPLAGLETGLMGADSLHHLFLSCDMPFVSAQTLLDLGEELQTHNHIACMEAGGRRGFPLAITSNYRPFIKAHLDEGRRSVYALFHHSQASVFTWTEEDRIEAMNVNTPDEFKIAKQWIQLHKIRPPVHSRHADFVQIVNPR